MNVFNTTIAPYAPEPTVAEQQAKIIELESKLDSMTNNYSRIFQNNTSLNTKIINVRGHIMDMYSINGELDEDIHEIARMLDIELTKTLSGTMTIEVEFTAEVPLNYDKDDLDLSYTIDCNSYDTDNFDWNEVSADWTVDED